MKRLRKAWRIYCAWAIGAMYGVGYFGSMLLTLHSETGARTWKRMVHLADVSAGKGEGC